MQINEQIQSKIKSFLDLQKDMRDKRIQRQWRGATKNWFNKWILSFFVILLFLLNLFFICEFILLSTSKNDISLQFSTTFNQGQFSYAYYSYNLGIVGMIYQRLDKSTNDYEFE